MTVEPVPAINPAAFARQVVRAALEYSRLPDPPDGEFYNRLAACFVSIKKNGELRGCMGTLEPVERDLAHEVIRNAQAAAFSDPRFSPLVLGELPQLKFSVDVLSAPEQVDSHEQLDCKKYGVIVGCDYRRGVLLPDLEGVQSVEHQLQIACQKAGIAPGEEFLAHRFTVARFVEGWQPPTAAEQPPAE